MWRSDAEQIVQRSAGSRLLRQTSRVVETGRGGHFGAGAIAQTAAERATPLEFHLETDFLGLDAGCRRILSGEDANPLAADYQSGTVDGYRRLRMRIFFFFFFLTVFSARLEIRQVVRRRRRCRRRRHQRRQQRPIL